MSGQVHGIMEDAEDFYDAVGFVGDVVDDDVAAVAWHGDGPEAGRNRRKVAAAENVRAASQTRERGDKVFRVRSVRCGPKCQSDQRLIPSRSNSAASVSSTFQSCSLIAWVRRSSRAVLL